MATNQTVVKPAEAKALKVKKEPIPAITRITKTLKAEAMRGKLTADELDRIGKLAEGLKAFIAA